MSFETLDQMKHKTIRTAPLTMQNFLPMLDGRTLLLAINKQTSYEIPLGEDVRQLIKSLIKLANSEPVSTGYDKIALKFASEYKEVKKTNGRNNESNGSRKVDQSDTK